ncbi:hypothetical protein OUZ56_006090 [Daphnia magna]|uniref:Uncharacterized protein n=1 Tax=Daphnia magna TaxID=35525 RepID=A0ABQ9YV84_9CRUS|nr:hypothetical protein OUZ56_006090 [Daphnia magna]
MKPGGSGHNNRRTISTSIARPRDIIYGRSSLPPTSVVFRDGLDVLWNGVLIFHHNVIGLANGSTSLGLGGQLLGIASSRHFTKVLSDVLRISDGIFRGGLVIFNRYPRDIQFGDRAVPRMSVGYHPYPGWINCGCPWERPVLWGKL